MLFKGVCLLTISIITTPSLQDDNSVLLSPSMVTVVEGEQATFTCSVSGGAWLSFSWWVIQTTYNESEVIIDDTQNTCELTGLCTSNRYRCVCKGNNKYEVTSMNTSRDMHDGLWRCSITDSSSFIRESNKSTLHVNVPVIDVQINDTGNKNLEVVENRTIQLQCRTSPSRPLANMSWYLDNVILHDPHKNVYQLLQDKINITISDITLTINRTMNGQEIRCNATNIINYPQATETLLLNVTYPANNPEVGCGQSDTYKVIANKESNITCTVSGGNPIARLSWNCNSEKQWTAQVVNDKVTQIVSLNLTNGTPCTCLATNVAGTTSTSVNIAVIYPPVIEKMQDLYVIEGDRVTMRCVVNGSTTMVQWKSNDHNLLDAVLTIPNVSRADDTIYTCIVNYTMQPSCQDVVVDSTDESLYLNVLYPPSVDIPLEFKTIFKEEGMMLRYNCTVVHGNPPTTNITWRRSVDSNIWTTSELLIRNVSRHDASVYTCYATNVMKRANGTTVIGKGIGNFTLIVQFKADVTSFYIRGFEHNISVVVEENTSLIFVCQLESHPTADVRIIHDIGTVVNSSRSNELFYNTTPSCTGRSEHYSCQGNNTLNKQPSNRQTDLLVRCNPRQDDQANIQNNITSAINHTVTLSYTALAYPHPNFTWYRNGLSIDPNDSRTTISSSDLQTNLTIYHVERSDFGQYVVNATNDVGSNNETFYLKPQGVPEVPTNVKQIDNTTTESIITLAWTPKVNNGLEQTFTLVYRQHPNGTWQGFNVTDTGEETIRYNITGLTSDTTYDVILYAFNILGRSRSNVSLSCTTNEKRIENSAKEENGDSAIAGAAGGSAAGVVLILGVIIGVIIFKRRSQYKQSHGNQSTTTTTSTSALYANVGNDQKYLLKKSKNTSEVQTDRTVYENAELGNKKSSMNNADKSNHQREYVNFSKKKPKNPEKTNEELPMRTMPPDVKVSTKRPSPSNLPPPVPAKTDFSKILSKVDDDDGHEISNVVYGDGNIYNNSTEKIEHIENVYVQELFDYVSGKSFQSFSTEFNVLPKGITMACTVAVKPENIKLNRYNGIFPYDHSRVIIPGDPDFFMNACYVDGFKNEKGYIASLGPTGDTTSGFKTFWKMVWHEQSDIIVMLTNLRELSGMKCEQYWPTLGPGIIYGEFTVTCIDVESFAEYTVRTFNVSHGGHNRSLTQLHFTAWPDKGVPDDLTSLLEFRQRMRNTPSPEPGRIIVHCSAGIGRTGTLIALDLLIAEGQTTNSINVSSCIRNLRQRRVNMVQTAEQYVYIYKACVYALAFKSECIPADKFREKLKKTTDAMFSDEFKKLKPMVDNESDKEKIAIQNNTQERSNRSKAEVAGDKHRVRLYVDKTSEDSDYINAVYINSFKTQNKCIAAQSPMSNFVQDFICMIFQEQCICVVDMDDQVPTKTDVGTYLPPVNQALTLGAFRITTTRLEDNPKYTVNKVKIENTGKAHKGEWTTYHFKYHDWKHNKETPSAPRDFVEFLKEVEEYATQFGEKESQVLVHCMDGSGKSGLFCFVACLLEKVECERQVNIGNTLRQVRNRRKTVVRSPNQLKFCYKTIDAFIDMNKSK